MLRPLRLKFYFSGGHEGVINQGSDPNDQGEGRTEQQGRSSVPDLRVCKEYVLKPD